MTGLEREGLSDVRPAQVEETPRLMRLGISAFSLVGRLALRVAAFVLLFAFAAELYVAQFFTYEPAVNWVRQPMVQLPWYHSIPEPLKEAVALEAETKGEDLPEEEGARVEADSL